MIILASFIETFGLAFVGGIIGSLLMLGAMR